jgi:hypothetical protein
MSTTPFPIDERLTAIAVGYAQTGLIADEVMPYVDVEGEKFAWTEYPIDQSFRLADDNASRTGALNTITTNGTKQSGLTLDRGLQSAVPQRDIEAAAANPAYDPKATRTKLIMQTVLNNREKRVSEAVFNLANYDASQRATLAGTAQWSDYANSDPMSVLLAAIDAMLMPANMLVLGNATWQRLRQNPKLVQAIRGSVNSTGVLRREEVADALEIEKIIVGTGRVNIAAPGQPASFARVWGKHAALLHINSLAQAGEAPTFGFTARWGSRVAGENVKAPGDFGLRGGVQIYSGESTNEMICAKLAGYYFENAVL